jgi:CspA family cold shock protein
MSSTNDVVTPSERLTGRVKWFNNSAGYGFITVTDGDKSGSDVFVHHSALEVESQQYKYLIQGEYVEFSLVKSSEGAHEWQVSNVNGIKGGKLMCETRREFKIARSSYKGVDSEPESREESGARESGPRQQRVPRESGSRESGSREYTPRARESGPRESGPRARGEGPRESGPRESRPRESRPRETGTDDKKEWTLVKQKEQVKPRGRPPRQNSEAK